MKCRCKHRLGEHDAFHADMPCLICGCPEFRRLETIETQTLRGTENP